MRIFIALDIDEALRERIQRFLEGVRGFAPDARWVRPESLHVTLKFIGEKPDETVEEIKRTLSTIQAESLDLTFRGYGFFPTLKSARVFWVGIESGPQLGNLAKKCLRIDFNVNFPGIGNGGLNKVDVLPLLSLLPDNVCIWERG